MSSGAVLVTGGTGFVGRPLLRRLAARGVPVRAAMRQPGAVLPAGAEPVVVGDIGPLTGWTEALAGIDTVVHLAARAHVLSDRAADPLALFRRINRDGTQRLAEAAAAAGVRRFVFVSSIKALAEQSGRQALTEADPPCPATPYGLSKWEAEQALAELAAKSGLDVVILRPPLVYGPEVKGNFRRLLDLCWRGLPLPLGRLDSRRSLLCVDNLIDAIDRCRDARAVPAGTYLLHDGPALSVSALLRAVAHALDRPARLVPVPASLLAAAARGLGRADAWVRLGAPLEVDDRHFRAAAGWQPPIDTTSGLQMTADWYRATRIATTDRRAATRR